MSEVTRWLLNIDDSNVMEKSSGLEYKRGKVVLMLYKSLV